MLRVRKEKGPQSLFASSALSPTRNKDRTRRSEFYARRRNGIYEVFSDRLTVIRLKSVISHEVTVMMDIVVGIVGIVLIVYLFATIIWPEKF